MLTTIALSLLSIIAGGLFSITLLVIIIRLKRELKAARAQVELEHELACILQQVARREWRLAQAWRERAEQDEIPEPFREGWER